MHPKSMSIEKDVVKCNPSSKSNAKDQGTLGNHLPFPRWTTLEPDLVTTLRYPKKVGKPSTYSDRMAPVRPMAILMNPVYYLDLDNEKDGG